MRLGIVKPGLYAMQVRAIVEAACEVKKGGGDPKVAERVPTAVHLTASNRRYLSAKADRGSHALEIGA